MRAQIREYHRRHPSARFVDTTDEYEHILKEEPVIEFTGEVSFVAFYCISMCTRLF